MPRTADPETRREFARGAGDAWTMVADLIAATGVWAAIGFGLDRWLGTWPVLFAIGAVLGHGVGIYMVFLRAQRMSARVQARRTDT